MNPEQMRERRNADMRLYYQRHKERIKARNLARYHAKRAAMGLTPRQVSKTPQKGIRARLAAVYEKHGLRYENDVRVSVSEGSNEVA